MSANAEANVKDATEASFEADVIERSRQVPVVVDFWAPWCGPCRALGPLIEREVAALGGRVELVKVNTDENPGLATRFQTMSIPAVKAFRDGAVVDEFVGARPAPFLKSFLARLAPSAVAQALRDALSAYERSAPDAEERLHAVASPEATTGDTAEARDDETARGEAAFRLAHWLLDHGRAAEALTFAAQVPARSELAGRVEALERLGHFADAGAAGADASEPAGRLLTEAAAAVRQGAWPAALAALLESVSRKPKYLDGLARQVMLAIFDHLEEPGQDGELARTYRRQLQIVT